MTLQLAVGAVADDPRAARAELAARQAGIDSVALSLGAGRHAGRGRLLPREARGAGRLIRLVAVTVGLLRRSRSLTARPTAVHAHDLDTLPAAFLIGRRHRARLVYDAHELYTGFDRDPPRLWLKAITHLEGALARRADAVLTVSDEIAERLQALHRLPARPSVVFNAPPLEDVDVEPHDGPLRVIYQAAAGPGRVLDDLPMVDDVDIAARVLGATTAPPHVRLLTPVGPDELVRALAGFDVGVVIDRPDTENARLALPNKLFEYLMAGLAVVVPRSPAMAALVEREQVGRAYEPGKLAEVLGELSHDRPTVEAMRRRARTVAVERYNAEAQRPALYKAWGV